MRVRQQDSQAMNVIEVLPVLVEQAQEKQKRKITMLSPDRDGETTRQEAKTRRSV